MAKVAFVLGEGFEDSEFRVPYDRLRAAGHTVDVIGAEAGTELKGKKGKERFTPELSASQVDSSSYDAVVIPGGYAPDHMRRHPAMIDLVRDAFEQGKIVAAVCYAGWMLASADIVRGKRVTCFASIKDDMINAGGCYEDAEVVHDGNLITSRMPDDLPAFCRTIKEALVSTTVTASAATG